MRKNRLLILIGIVIFIALVHSTYILNGFTWLDHGDIEGTRALLPLSKIYLAFISRFGETGFYRPLVTFFHVTDAVVYGPWAPGFHLTNLAFHLAASVAAALFVSAFLPITVMEFMFVVLLFGIHPLSWLPVGSISYRPELLVSLWTFLAIYMHAKSRTSGSTAHRIIAVCSIILALFSKETALFWIPALIFVWEYAAKKIGPPEHLMSARKGHSSNGYALIAAEVIAIIFYVMLRMYAVPEIWRVSATSQSVVSAVLTRLYVLGNAIVNLTSPLKPSLSDAVPVSPLLHPYILVAIVAIVLFVGSIKARKKYPRASLAAILLLISLLPALNIAPLPRFNSPHYGYFAVAAAALATLLFYRHAVKQNKQTANILRGVAVVWILVASFSVYRFGHRFQDDVSLFTPEVKADPHFLEGSYYLGSYYWQKGDYANAGTYFKQALPDDASYIAFVDSSSLYINYGGLLLMQGSLNEAETYLIRSQDYSPLSMKPLIAYNLALVAAKKNDYQRVTVLLDQNDIHWNRAEPLLLLADAYYRIGKKTESVAVLKNTLPLLSDAQRKKVEEFIKTESAPAPTVSPAKKRK